MDRQRVVMVAVVAAAGVNMAANVVTALTLLGELRHWWDVL